MTMPIASAAPTAKGPIAARWETDDADRHTILERARTCAALTKPWVLPPLDQQANQKLPQNYQSVGSRGIMTMVGKMLVALWPLGEPWFDFDMAANLIADESIPADRKQAVRDALFMQKLVILSKLESSEVDDDVTYRGAVPFRTAKRQALDQLLITGDVLEQLTDDYQIKVFRRDQYVTRRNTEGAVLYHIIREQIDPLELTKKQQAAAQLPDGHLDKPVADRMVDIYTNVEWMPAKRRWMIEQEVNGQIIGRSEEMVSPYFSTPYELTSGDHYGRGFVELNLGDLTSFDRLNERELDYATLASKLLAALDYGSEVRESDLEKKTGSVIRARVENGQIQDIGFLNVNKVADMSMVFQKTDRLGKELGKAMLMESEIAPNKDRVTRFQVERLAMEVDQALGGSYAPIADHQQRPLLSRVIFQLRRDRLLPKLPKKTVEVRMLTGLAALARANKAADISGFVSAIAAFPEITQRLNQGVLLQVLTRYANVNEPGLIKTEEEFARDIQQAIAAQTQAAAQQKAVDVAGNVIEASAQPSANSGTATPAR